MFLTLKDCSLPTVFDPAANLDTISLRVPAKQVLRETKINVKTLLRSNFFQVWLCHNNLHEHYRRLGWSKIACFVKDFVLQ